MERERRRLLHCVEELHDRLFGEVVAKLAEGLQKVVRSAVPIDSGLVPVEFDRLVGVRLSAAPCDLVEESAWLVGLHLRRKLAEQLLVQFGLVRANPNGGHYTDHVDLLRLLASRYAGSGSVCLCAPVRQLSRFCRMVAANVEIFSPGNTATCARQPVPGP